MDELFGEGVVGVSHAVEVGAVGVVASDGFDEGGAVFGCTVGCADVSTVDVEAVEG